MNQMFDKTLTLMDLVDDWLNVLASQGYAKQTLITYHQALKNFQKFLHQKQHCWQQLKRTQITDYLSQRLELDNLSKTSVQLEITILRQFFHWLQQHQYISHNPMISINMKRQAKAMPNLLDTDIIFQLLDQPSPTNPQQQQLWLRDKAMLELLYGSGLRVSELVGLNLTDIDISQQILTIKGKGNKTRLVPIGKQTWQALQNYLPIRQLWLQTDTMAVFISQKLGKRLSTRTVQSRIKIQAKRANIAENLYPHLLRHCFASHLLSNGADLRGIQELLGHRDIGTTQIYTHLDFGHLAKVYDNAHPRAKKS